MRGLERFNVLEQELCLGEVSRALKTGLTQNILVVFG